MMQPTYRVVPGRTGYAIQRGRTNKKTGLFYWRTVKHAATKSRALDIASDLNARCFSLNGKTPQSSGKHERRRKPSQVDRLYQHFKNGGTITSLEATLHFGITQITARISEIEKRFGVTVKREWVKVGDKRVKRYSLGKRK